MSTKAQEFIQKIEAEQKKKKQAEMTAFLHEHGAYEKVYNDHGAYYDSEAQKYYDVAPFDVSDEEYEKIKTLLAVEKPSDTKLIIEKLENIRKMVFFFYVVTIISIIIAVIGAFVTLVN